LGEYNEQNTSQLLTVIVKYDQQINGGQWLYNEFQLNRPGIKFRLSFIAQLDQNNKQFVAIDDIDVKEGYCANITHMVSPKSCDFHDYSLDKQHKCGYSCDFETNNTCNWTVNNVTSTFIITDLSKGKSIPARDHTKKSDFNGKYLRLLNISGQYDKIPEAQLISPVIRHSSPICKFTFHYYMSDALDRAAVLSIRLWPSNTGRLLTKSIVIN